MVRCFVVSYVGPAPLTPKAGTGVVLSGGEGGQYNVVVAAVVEVVKRDFLVSCTRKKEVPLWKSRQNFGGKKVVGAGFRRKKVVSLLPSVVLEAVGTEETHSLLEGRRDT
ncbi:unnamed protein product [Sphagnum jensenii]